MMSDRKVVFVIGSMGQGGAEAQLALLARSLKVRDWQVFVYVLELKQTQNVQELYNAGVKILDGRYRSSAPAAVRILMLVRSFGFLLFFLLKIRPDVVNGFLPLTNFMASCAARISMVPVIVTSRRALGTHQDRHPKLRWLDRAANRLSHVITANSQAVAADVQRRDKYPADRIAVIPNGLEWDRFLDAAAGSSQVRRALGLLPTDIGIVKVANIIPYKGHLDLIEAYAMLLPEFPNSKLYFVGEDRGSATTLTQRCEELGISGRVSFLGGGKSVPEVLSAMDVGVMASHEEGMPNALIEKLAAGLPVVATNVGGIPEVIQGMPNCHLVRPRDPADLARALRLTLSTIKSDTGNDEVRKRIARDRFSVDNMVNAYESLFLRQLRGT